ncbi:MAG: hypothetical protein ACP5RN_08950, partial [Armatimonadota bacterium]
MCLITVGGGVTARNQLTPRIIRQVRQHRTTVVVQQVHRVALRVKLVDVATIHYQPVCPKDYRRRHIARCVQLADQLFTVIQVILQH